MKEYIDFANYLADKSGEIIRKYFRLPHEFMLEHKEDKTPVTKADKEAEHILREIISKKYPSHGIIGEEFPAMNEKAEFKWVLDPIDGTSSFICGKPSFGTLIALVRNDEPVVGIIDQPIIKERWSGVKEGGSLFNGKLTGSNQNVNLTNAKIATTSLHLLSVEAAEIFNKIDATSKYKIFGGDCYNYALIASGFIDIVIESGLKKHDFCALAPIIKEAGGVISDFEGNEININSNGNIIACANKKLHKEILQIITKV